MNNVYLSHDVNDYNDTYNPETGVSTTGPNVNRSLGELVSKRLLTTGYNDGVNSAHTGVDSNVSVSPNKLLKSRKMASKVGSLSIRGTGAGTKNPARSTIGKVVKGKRAGSIHSSNPKSASSKQPRRTLTVGAPRWVPPTKSSLDVDDTGDKVSHVDVPQSSNDNISSNPGQSLVRLATSDSVPNSVSNNTVASVTVIPNTSTIILVKCNNVDLIENIRQLMTMT